MFCLVMFILFWLWLITRLTHNFTPHATSATQWHWWTPLWREELIKLPKMEIATQHTKIDPINTNGVWSSFAARFSSFSFFKSWMCPCNDSSSSVRNLAPYFAESMRFVLSKAARHLWRSFSVLSLELKRLLAGLFFFKTWLFRIKLQSIY